MGKIMGKNLKTRLPNPLTVKPAPGKKGCAVCYGDNVYLIARRQSDGAIARWWSLRYRFDGRAREKGLGGAANTTPREAKTKAAAILDTMAKTGVDPLAAVEREKAAEEQQKAEARADSEKSATFDMAAGEYIEIHHAAWSSPVHARQWEQTLADYASPHIGRMDMRKITADHVAAMLAPIWLTKHVTAARLRGRVEKIFGYAAAKGYFPEDRANPAQLRGKLEHLLPTRKRGKKAKHHTALPWQQMPDFMAKLAAVDAVSARALEWCIFTATRTSETLGARWSEIDLGAKVWTVPAERMKMKEEHRVPLSAQALAVLEHIERDGDLVFANKDTGEALSNMAMLEMVRGLVGMGNATTHGFRASFRQWCADETNYPTETCEAALAHSVGTKVQRAYQRSDVLDRRVSLMQAWADWIRPSAASAKVVSLKGRRT
jgi:integrase